jgi:type II secretory pathway component GspD/PulD (secretin)
MFPQLSFSYGAGISVRAPSVSGSDSSSGSAGEALQPTMSSGATTFSAVDKDPTYLVASGPPEDVSRFKSFLAQVDVRVPEVLLQAHVFEVRNTDGRDGGVRVVLDMLNGKFGAVLGGSSAATSDVFRLTLPNLSVAVSALTSDSRVKLVSSPVLRAADGSTASATIGTSVPTLGSIVSQNGSTQQSVSYQESGVLLSVSPRVLEQSIRLVISQELSSFVRTETGLSGSPTKLKRAFKSDVVARSGESLLLGGLSEVQDTESKQTTFFGFGNSASSKSSSEIVVLLTATRLDTAAQAADVRMNEERTDPRDSPAPQ